ncbi:hypothetical protein CMI44_01135 [Candidatus Pacearchaeota archaeon]|jgi:Icc-related predicted phosphoesterase|nr:hypothetical protein [Candidatus Pacearchaeota archaeon]|tara:strand:+ start:136 stop:759 length:624 start_codon:yes stop_codon:yes gene_type:complete
MKKSSKNKLKILAIGDLHGDSGLIRKLAQRAQKENVDLVLMAGDLTNWEFSTDNIVGPFLKAKKDVLIVPGNHESFATIDFLTEMYPNAKNLHGYSFKKKGVGIFGAGLADIGMTHVNDKEMFEILKQAHKGLKKPKKKIMVTHMHPAKSKSEFSGFKGSKGITKAIKEFKPDIHIHSHIHEAEGAEEKIGKTKVVNIGKKGRVFEV